MLDILIKDCIDNIKSYLSFMDLLCYRLTNKSNHYKIILPNFRDLFIKRLLQHDIVPSLENAELFCDNLYNTGAYVAGSFILDCIFNTNYHGDIDIYDQTGFDLIPIKNGELTRIYHECCQEENDREYEYSGSDKFKDFGSKNMQFTQSLYKLGFKNIKSKGGPDPIIRHFLYKSNQLVEEHRGGDGYPNWFSIKEPTNNCIQIIPINMSLKVNERSVIPRFIKSTFDLDICKNIFDGKSLQIKNLNKLIYKYDYIKPNTRFMFTIYEYDDEETKDVFKERMKKYLERGFNIEIHPEYDKIDKYVIDILKLKKYNMWGHQNCIINNTYEKFDLHQNNIKYIDNGEIDLSIFDID
jgi:hypothetical protein